MKKKKMGNRRRTMMQEVKLNIARDTIVSQVAAFLYATKMLNEKDNVIDITFGETDSKDLVPITVIYEKEVAE